MAFCPAEAADPPVDALLELSCPLALCMPRAAVSTVSVTRSAIRSRCGIVTLPLSVSVGSVVANRRLRRVKYPAVSPWIATSVKPACSIVRSAPARFLPAPANKLTDAANARGSSETVLEVSEPRHALLAHNALSLSVRGIGTL